MPYVIGILAGLGVPPRPVRPGLPSRRAFPWAIVVLNLGRGSGHTPSQCLKRRRPGPWPLRVGSPKKSRLWRVRCCADSAEGALQATLRMGAAGRARSGPRIYTRTRCSRQRHGRHQGYSPRAFGRGWWRWSHWSAEARAVRCGAAPARASFSWPGAGSCGPGAHVPGGTNPSPHWVQFNELARLGSTLITISIQVPMLREK